MPGRHFLRVSGKPKDVYKPKQRVSDPIRGQSSRGGNTFSTKHIPAHHFLPNKPNAASYEIPLANRFLSALLNKLL